MILCLWLEILYKWGSTKIEAYYIYSEHIRTHAWENCTRSWSFRRRHSTLRAICCSRKSTRDTTSFNAPSWLWVEDGVEFLALEYLESSSGISCFTTLAAGYSVANNWGSWTAPTLWSPPSQLASLSANCLCNVTAHLESTCPTFGATKVVQSLVLSTTAANPVGIWPRSNRFFTSEGARVSSDCGAAILWLKEVNFLHSNESSRLRRISSRFLSLFKSRPEGGSTVRQLGSRGLDAAFLTSLVFCKSSWRDVRQGPSW